MSDFKKGDRVKVTYEGTVNYVDSGGGVDVYREVDEMYLGTARPDRVNVEKLTDPLPTTPGSVIAFKGWPSKWVRMGDGRWRTVSGDYATDTAFNPDEYDVLFDAGAVK